MNPVKRAGILHLFVITAFFVSGCSREDWTARFYMMKAENAYTKAGELKLKRAPYETRLQYYRDACENFLKAYHSQESIFTLYRIESAADACWRIKDSTNRELFHQFQERYEKEHPTETEYGDVAPALDGY